MLAGKVDLRSHKRTFEEHWRKIMVSDSQPASATDREHMRRWPGALAIDYELLSTIIGKLKPGCSGGEDGVAAEFIQASSFDAKVRLAETVRRVLEGVAPVPKRWR